MSDPQNNGTRLSPESKLARQVNELFMNYLMTGGTNEYLIGLCHQLSTFAQAPAKLAAERQAEQMLQARGEAPKTPENAPNPRLTP